MSKSEEKTRTSKNCKFASSSCVSYCGFTTFISTVKISVPKKNDKCNCKPLIEGSQ